MTETTKRLFSAEIRHLRNADPAATNETRLKFAHPGSDAHDEILAEIQKLREEISKGSAAVSNAANLLSDAESSVDGELSAERQAAQAEIESYRAELNEAATLKAEIIALSQAIETTKQEIAALRYNGKDADRISDVTHELDAVVGDTEKATETILENCESIEKLVETLELQASSPEERATIEDVGAQVIGIYEACNFQDITGQRISKVVAALMFIEERVTRMMEIWGGTDIFAAIPLPEVQAKSEEDLLLNGPAREDAESATQADIDALFD
ncbi:MAG TPA: chemotaxis protein [Alphaproteobacteria bacterium]|nr:chemotaxis protein [Alphaproteobacteria bacterium]